MADDDPAMQRILPAELAKRAPELVGHVAEIERIIQTISLMLHEEFSLYAEVALSSVLADCLLNGSAPDPPSEQDEELAFQLAQRNSSIFAWMSQEKVEVKKRKKSN